MSNQPQPHLDPPATTEAELPAARAEAPTAGGLERLTAMEAQATLNFLGRATIQISESPAAAAICQKLAQIAEGA